MRLKINVLFHPFLSSKFLLFPTLAFVDLYVVRNVIEHNFSKLNICLLRMLIVLTTSTWVSLIRKLVYRKIIFQ